MSNIILIPDFINISKKNAELNLYSSVFEVTPIEFILHDNGIYRLGNNKNELGERLKCIVNKDNKYKIYSYKIFGAYPTSIFIIHDVLKSEFYYNSTTTLDGLKDWLDYLLSGGSYSEAKMQNSKRLESFNPFKNK